MIYKVYFVNRRGNNKPIGRYNSVEKAYNRIQKFCDKNGYTIPYMRSREDEETKATMIDVGSPNEFFKIEEAAE